MEAQVGPTLEHTFPCLDPISGAAWSSTFRKSGLLVQVDTALISLLFS